jgi:hypothetical protein
MRWHADGIASDAEACHLSPTLSSFHPQFAPLSRQTDTFLLCFNPPASMCHWSSGLGQ